MMPPIAILAGGLATRLYPLTKYLPKAMIEVAGKPFIHHQLELLKKNEITKVVICVGNLGEQIRNYVKDGSEYGIRVDYSSDGDKLLGTGGALKKAISLLDDVFWVMYGDSYLRAEFNSIYDFYLKTPCMGLMTVFRNENNWDKSNIIFKDNKIMRYDRNSLSTEMKYIDYGLSILTKKAFSAYAADVVFDLSDIYRNLINQNEMLGYEVKERFYEMGSSEGLNELNRFLSSK